MNLPILTDTQRKMVQDNLGLVGTHLRRFISRTDRPRRDREWDDLFQEGCIGLAHAAAAYDPATGLPFASYALKRIHAAVSRAFPRVFATVHVPEAERTGDAKPRRVVTLDIDPPTRDTTTRHDPLDEGPRETIGDRLRGKLEAAVRDAVRTIERDRPHRARIARRVAHERMLIPNENHRWGLRKIVRETGSTYASVTHAEKRIAALVRTSLDDDAEFHALRATARRSPDGHATRLDRGTRQLLSETLDRRLNQAVASSSHDQQGVMLLRLTRLRGWTFETLIRQWFIALTIEQKGSLLSARRPVVEGEPGT